MKILLVDDSKTILHENERVLIKAGYEVVCAEDGQSALDLARERKPDRNPAGHDPAVFPWRNRSAPA